MTCSAIDAAGNRAEKIFTVTVVDTVRPLVTVQVNADSYFFGATAGIVVRTSDVVGVTAVTVNGVAASFTGGAPGDAFWQASVPITQGVALSFTATVRDAAGNTNTATAGTDNDGIFSTVDKRRDTLTDQSTVYSADFV